MKNKKKETTQKFNWKQVKIFESYEDAHERANRMSNEGHQHLKIRRCGPGGTKFKLLSGSRIKKPEHTQEVENGKSAK